MGPEQMTLHSTQDILSDVKYLRLILEVFLELYDSNGSFFFFLQTITS